MKFVIFTDDAYTRVQALVGDDFDRVSSEVRGSLHNARDVPDNADKSINQIITNILGHLGDGNWTVLAMPLELTKLLHGGEATQQNVLEFSRRVQAQFSEMEKLREERDHWENEYQNLLDELTP